MRLLAPTAGLRRRSFLYGQLAVQHRAGLPVPRMLAPWIAAPSEPGLQAVARRLQSVLGHGGTWTEAFGTIPGWAPPFDLALIEAGERSGRLDEAFDTLARHHRRHAENLLRLLRLSAYPLLVLHVAVVVVPLPQLVMTGDLGAYLVRTLGVLAAAYGLVGGILWGASGRRPEAWRARVEQGLLRVPLLGTARSSLALGRLAGSLEALLSAGVLVTEAWPMAARASGSPALVHAVGAWPDALSGGRTPAELVAEHGPFPPMFVSLYTTGEVSGKLDEQLRWLAQHYEAEGYDRLQAFATWLPKLAYAGLALWIIAYVLLTFAGYVDLVNQLLA